MTLLSIVQRVARLVTIQPPTSVVTNTQDTQVQQLYELVNEEGRDLASSYDWQVLMQQQTFVTVAAAAQPGVVPSDWDRFIPDSFFNRTLRRKVFGPVTPQTWQAIQAMPQLNSVFLAFRERDGVFLISPDPPAGQTIAYEYVSQNWAASATGTAQPQFQADSDVTYLSENIIALGARWRWKAAKGLDYAEDMKTYGAQKEQQQARDGGSAAINITGAGDYSWGVNVPEGNFPGN